LQADIYPEVQLRIENQPTKSLEAYNLWLEGKFRHGNGEDGARELFEKAIQADPNFVPGYASLGGLWLDLGGFAGLNISDSLINYEQKASYYLEYALEIDPDYAPTHAAMANLQLWYKWDFTAAERELNTFKRLNPASNDVNNSEINFLTASGRFDEAIKLGEKLLALDPERISLWAATGLAYYFTGQMEKGNSHYDMALKLFPSTTRRWNLDIEAGRVFIYAERYQSTINLLTGLLRTAPFARNPRVLASLAIAYYHLEDQKKSNELLNEIIAISKKSPTGSPSFYLAMVYAQMQEIDTAYKWLEKAYNDHEVEMYWLKVEPPFEPLWSDPRWQEMLDKVGFPD